MAHPILRFLCLATWILSSACSDGDGDTGGFRITAPGTGVASSGVLSPTWAGVRRIYDDGIATTVLGSTERWGKTVVRFQGGDDVRFFRMSDSVGLLYDGTTRIGQVKPPILLAPPAVKDGMKWETLGASGKVLGTFTVTAKGRQDSIFGKLPIWRVTQHNEVTSNEFWTEYAEGRGAVTADDRHVLAAVVPLEPRAALKVRSRLALTASGDGKPLFTGFAASNASLIQPASGPATLRIGGNTVGFDSANTKFYFTPAVLCGKVAGGVVTVPPDVELTDGASSAATCADASAAVLKGGQMVSVAVTGLGVLESPLGGPFVDADGVVRAIGPLSDHGYDKFWVRDEPGKNTFGDLPGHGGSLDLPWRQEGPISHILTSAVQTSDAVGFAVRMGDRLLHGRSDSKGFSPLRFVGSVPGAHLSTRLDSSGRRYFYLGTDGTIDELTITTDGASLARLAELDLPEGHELVGVVPEGEGKSADLLVLTLAGRVDIGPFQTSQPMLGDLYAWHVTVPAVPSDPAYEGPSAAELNIVATPSGPDVQVCWTTGKADTTGWTLGGHPAKVVSARTDDSCVMVLRDQSAPFDPMAFDAWLVEGPVPGVGRVAIAQDPSRAMNGYPTPDAQLVIAALSGGGFGSKSLLYGPAGSIVGAPPASVSISGQFNDPGLTDAGGLGVWGPSLDSMGVCGMSPSPCAGVMRWGIDTVLLHGPIGLPSAGRIAPLAGGGLLWEGYANEYLLLPEGSVQALPKVDATYITNYKGGQKDGLACGIHTRTIAQSVYEYDLFCRDPGGAFRVLQVPSAFMGIGDLQAYGWWPGSGGFYVPSTNDRKLVALYVNPATLTAAPLDLQGFVPPQNGVVAPSWSATGELFLFVTGSDDTGKATGTILQIADGKATATIPIPADRFPGDPNPAIARTPVLLVGPQLLILATNANGPTAVLRIPRP